MRLNLCRVWIPGQAQTLHKLFSMILPIYVRVCRQVRVVVAHSPVYFAQKFDIAEGAILPAQPRHDVGHFFSESSRARRLSMGPRQHRRRSL